MNDSSQKDTDLKEKTYLDFEVVSPIHIGTKDGNLSALEFVFHENKTYIIDENKLSEFLKKNNNLIDKFVEKVRDSHSFNMRNFLSANNIPIEKCIKDISKTPIPEGSAGMNAFRPFVRDGNGDIFLPGSSIKGVFRTALLYGIFKNDEETRKNVEKSIDTTLKNIFKNDEETRKNVEKNIDSTLNKKKNRLSEWQKKHFSSKLLPLEKNQLQNFKLLHAKEEQHKDILRCLTVRDAYPIDKDKIKSQIINIQILSKGNENGFYFKLFPPIWTEAISKGKFRFELIWDKKLFQKFQDENKNMKMPISGIDDLKKFVFQMNKDIFKHEKEEFYSSENGTAKDAAKVLKQWHENNENNQLIRIGFGSGMLSTTVNSSFEYKDNNNLTIMQRIRNICHNRDKDTSTAPKSRRVCQNGYGQWQPMGWLKIDSNDIVKAATAESERKAAQVSTPKYSQATKPSAVKMEASKPIQIRKQEIVEEKPSISQLKDEINKYLRHNDRLQMERIVQEIEYLEDENDQREAATALMEKLKAAGKNESVWKKHPLRKKIEFILEIQV